MSEVIYPTAGQLAVSRPVLQNTILSLSNRPGSMVAHHLFPKFTTPRTNRRSDGAQGVHTQGKIRLTDPGAFFSSPHHDGKWPIGDEPYRQIGVAYSHVDYKCLRWASESATDLHLALINEHNVDINQDALKQSIAFLAINREYRRAQIVTNPANAANTEDLTGRPTEQWSDAAGNPINSSDPMGQLQDRVEALQDWGIGGEEIHIVLPRTAYRPLLRHSQILSGIPITERRMGRVSPGRLRTFVSAEFEIPLTNVHYAGGRRRTSLDGGPVTLADIWPDTVVVAYVKKDPSNGTAIPDSGDIMSSTSAFGCIEAMPMTPDTYDEKRPNLTVDRIFHWEADVPLESRAVSLLINTQT